MARLDTSSETEKMARSAQSGTPLGSEIKQKMYDSGQAARQKLGAQAEALTEKAADLGEQQKSIGAQQLASVASAVLTAANELQQQMPQAANLVRSAAQHIESASTALRERRVGDLMNDISDFTRERPFTVFGGAVLAGFALTRFLKSSAQRSLPRQQETGTLGDLTNRDFDALDRGYEGRA